LLLFDRQEPHILAIQKSDNEGYPWRNQVALPGGHVDKKDLTRVDTAFRELEEELKITRNQVEFFGSMGHFSTVRNKDIEVFVGFWNETGPVWFDSREIARVIKIPLNEIVKIHKAKNFHVRFPDNRVLVYQFEDVFVWGLTARIFYHFIELLYPYLTCKQ